MSSYVPLMGLLGLGAGCGLVLLIHAWWVPTSAARPVRCPRRREPRRHAGRWLAVATGAGLLVGAITGWVVGGLLAAMGGWSLPRILGSGTADREQTARIEGIAGWTEMLRDTLAAAAGLEQTILATASAAPEGVRPQVADLAARLERGERLTPALRHLADDLDDPTADLVIAALILASEHQARQLASLLGELAATARAQVEMRHRVEAGRTRTRTTMRVVVITTLTFAGALILFNPQFLTPYDSMTGQLILLLIGALFTVAFMWLRRMARIEEPDRFFTGLETVGHAPEAAATLPREVT
ncbi:type II secretion system F family protein [Streptomyces fulvoviolaceus]|uniref:type II secretion system F family protein n=1 Tax=Streptomyces fulvoviolaceus TaxID=285535 RepID=UPI0021C12ADF|nr:type II secretion system F family protein [Streptomyces fulvoviolaceus]MCT9080463.1 type II secretion protein F [Streptomyces fulvoviolaceus]